MYSAPAQKPGEGIITTIAPAGAEARGKTTGARAETGTGAAVVIPYEIDTNLARRVTPALPSSPMNSPSTSEEMEAFLRIPLPIASLTHPYQQPWLSEAVAGNGLPLLDQSRQLPQHQQPYPFSFSAASHQVFESNEPRKPLTSIAGSSRCLWPPDSTFLTMTDEFKERAFQHRQIGPESTTMDHRLLLSASPVLNSQKNHPRSDCFKDANDMLELQPRRKARRVMEGAYFKGMNHQMVETHIRKLIQEAVEDGVGELDLSNLELNDLPSDIRDLNFAIIYNERGSLSLSKNRLKLFLSSNHFTTIPMDVFALLNLSVLSLRNNCIETIPAEIGLLVNLVELSVGGNQLKVIPSQVALLPKLNILTVHPNPFMTQPEPESETTVVTHPPTNQDLLQAFHEGVGADTIGPVAGQETGLSELSQHAIPSLLISPPASPSMYLEEDIDMVSPTSEQDGIDIGSSSFTTMGSISFDADAMDEGVLSQESSFSQGSTLLPSSLVPRPTSAVTVRAEATLAAEAGTMGNEYRNTSVTTDEPARPLPPHKVTRSRFPTLLALAGNALLSYMDVQAKDRPRKDNKMSMDGESGSDNHTGSHDDMHASPCLSSDGHYQHSPLKNKKKYVFKEEKIEMYLTPHLFEDFKRARTINRCAGCQKTFWKPCRTTVVWQDLLGQTRIPIEWKGCGIGGCPGVPASIWSTQGSLPSPSTSQSGAAAAAAAAAAEPTPPILPAALITTAGVPGTSAQPHS
ncbi:MAG: hypothetical protein J3Q66DRAFT_354020 [Benniella sp.]|nr:MAG: hypothetical protein J3Q66DRAFT_354020 [Benniella sp.]